MKITASKLKKMIDNKVDNQLVEKVINYQFGTKLIPTLITENEIVFYETGKKNLLYSTYEIDEDNSVVLEGLRKITINSEEDELDERFNDITKGVFELDEDRTTFQQSVKKIKNLVKKDKVIMDKDKFFDSLRDTAAQKLSSLLRKPNKSFDNWNSAYQTFKEHLNRINPEVVKEIGLNFEKSMPKYKLNSFYDYLDVNKKGFKKYNSIDLYKIMKIEMPKDKQWMNENKNLLSNYGVQWERDMSPYGSIVDDTIQMLKDKKYIDDDSNPSKDRFVDLLSYGERIKGKKKTYWKNQNFKKDFKDLMEDEIEIEDFIDKYPIVHYLSEEEGKDLLGKTLIAIYDDPTMIKEGKEIFDILTFVADKEKLADQFVSEFLEVDVNNGQQLIKEELGNPIGDWIQTYRDKDDLNLKAISLLNTAIQNQLSKQRETPMSNNGFEILTTILFRINDILARERLTPNDKAFLNCIVSKFYNVINGQDIETVDDFNADKETRRNGRIGIENNILNKNNQMGLGMMRRTGLGRRNF